MGQLSEIMLDPARKTEVITAYTLFIRDRVMERGFSVRTAYAAFKRMKKNNVEDSVELLLPGFMEVLDGYYEVFLASGAREPSAFPAWIGPSSAEAASKLLDITDKVMADSGKTNLQKLYGMIRGAAHKYVAAAIPGMAGVASEFLEGA